MTRPEDVERAVEVAKGAALRSCPCYRFDIPPADPMTCGHCWHDQYDIQMGSIRLHCGRCGTWRDLFTG